MFKVHFRRKLTAAAIAAAVGLSSAQIYAASNTAGAISGEVKTLSDQPVSNVSITIRNTDTGVIRTLSTDSSGSFQLPRLPIGNYEISATKSGFQNYSQDSVKVTIGQKTSLDITLAAAGETVTILGGAISPVDTTSAETALVMSEEEIDRLPVARNATSIALLAPGTTRGDAAFGNLASFGGSSVGENVYYINGMNLTNFRNGLGGSTVPFEFYQEFQVKTGGYSAEFGRSTGGVINGVTKSGTNEFEAGFNIIHSPNKGREQAPNVVYSVPSAVLDSDGNPTIETETRNFIINDQDEYEETSINLYASGALIENELFYYVLYNPRFSQQDNVYSRGSRYDQSNNDDAFWGAKLDWNINSDHLLELTAFSDENENSTLTYNYDADNRRGTGLVGETLTKTGGSNTILKYTGHVSADLTISAMWGESEYDRTSESPLDGNPAIYDSRGGGLTALGDWVNLVAGSGFDTREAMRLDFDYFMGDHEMRFGLDREVNTAEDSSFYSGHIYYRYFDDTRSSTGESVRVRVFEGGGEFETISSAFYFEDTWTVNDRLTLRLGIRNEAFDNKNANGDSFIKIDNQWAPRLGAAYDLNGDGKQKLFANFGRYHLPIAANTNIRLAGAELFTQDYYQLDGLNADDTPQFDPANVIDQQVFGDGSVPDTRAVKDANIGPMYQDELILGYERSLGDDWSMSVRAIHRDLKATIEDVAIDAAVLQWADQNGLSTTVDGEDPADVWTGFHQYVLTNPGQNMRVWLPEFEQYANLSADLLNYPESERRYNALNLVFDKKWDGLWAVNASYTWAQSYGNNEGYVRSDNGQDDAGLTTLFDQPGLLDGAFGYLPNDRRHSLKVFGAYQLTDDVRLSVNYLYESGRPMNAFGVHPTDVFAAAYGAESFYQDGELVKRGSRGRTAAITQFDFGVNYDTEIMGHPLTLKADVFNVFNSNNVREVVETAEQESGVADPTYMLPTSFQTPRYFRVSASMNF